MSKVMNVEFVNDRASYIMLRGCWCDIVLNVLVPTEDKTDNTKGSFCEELESAFDQFSKLERDFFKPANGNR
jgi:hypothetical protein